MREFLAKLYGFLPNHLGKWRVIHALLPSQRPHEWRTVRCEGFVLSVDIGSVMGEHLYYGRCHERWETAQARLRLKPGDIALDIGANIGYYSLLFSRLVGPNGKVYAFEPAPENLEALQRNVNGVNNVKVIPVALSDRNGVAHLAGNTADTLSLGNGNGKPVDVVTLDAWATEYGLERLDFLKADIEGHEIPMLRGAERTIRQFRPTMLLEASAGNQRQCGKSLRDLRQVVLELGYRPFRIHRRKLIPWTEDKPGSESFGLLAVP